MHARITGTGTDAAGRTFTLSGTVSQDGFEADFWADDGNVVVRRDDGAFARDAGVIGAHGIVNSPPLALLRQEPDAGRTALPALSDGSDLAVAD